MSTLVRLWTRVVTLVTAATLAILVPAQAWAAGTAGTDLAKVKPAKGLAKGLGAGAVCCLLVVALIVLVIVLLVRRGRRRHR